MNVSMGSKRVHGMMKYEAEVIEKFPVLLIPMQKTS